MHVCVNILSLACAYLYIGFEQDVGKFFFFMLTVSLLSSTISAMAFAISARAPVTTVGIVGTAVCFIVQIVRL